MRITLVNMKCIAQCLWNLEPVSKFYLWVRKMLNTSREIILIWKKSMHLFYMVVWVIFADKVIIFHKPVQIDRTAEFLAVKVWSSLVFPSSFYCNFSNAEKLKNCSKESYMYYLHSTINICYVFYISPSIHLLIHFR